MATGHAFGAGAVFAIAHDYRVMNSERGWICWNEVDINIPIPERLIHDMRFVVTIAHFNYNSQMGIMYIIITKILYDGSIKPYTCCHTHTRFH